MPVRRKPHQPQTNGTVSDFVQTANGLLAERLARASLIGAVMILPFERALAAAGGFTLTTVEAALMVMLAAAIVACAIRARTLVWPSPLVVPGLLWVGSILLAALVAQVEAGNAFKFSARMVAAGAICLATLNIVTTPRLARIVVGCWLAVASAVAVIALLESAQVAWVVEKLTLFRPGFHVAGRQLRATGTLLYPTIASMYLEVPFALGLWLLMEPGSRWKRAVVFGALAVVGAGITATLTRAGLLGMAAALGLTATVRIARLGWARAGVGVVIALALVLGGIAKLTLSPELLAARLQSEGSSRWYGAVYEVPLKLRLDAGTLHRIPLRVSNTGRFTWDSTVDPKYAMSYHWLRSGSDEVIEFDGIRTPFPQPVLPNESLSFPVTVKAPRQPGSYTLVWDVVLESRAWLSSEHVPPARTEVEVAGSPAGTINTVMQRLPVSAVRPPRPDLWRAALQIAGERRWLGIGPDGFRHVYGPHLGLADWDRRVHANNMYLEALTGSGLIGLTTLLWLMTATGLALVRQCHRVPAGELMPAIAMLAAWVVVAGHGLVDSFLTFTPTYASFAIAAGLAFSTAIRHGVGPRLAERNGRAHRV